MTKASLLQSRAFNHQNLVSIAEIMVWARYDWVAIDMEHSTISQHQPPNLFRALKLDGAPPLVRLGQGTAIKCKQALNAGAGFFSDSVVGCAEQMERVKVRAARAVGAVKMYRVPARGVVRFGFRRLCRIGSGALIDRGDRTCLGGEAPEKTLIFVNQLNTMHSMGTGVGDGFT